MNSGSLFSPLLLLEAIKSRKTWNQTQSLIKKQTGSHIRRDYWSETCWLDVFGCNLYKVKCIGPVFENYYINSRRSFCRCGRWEAPSAEKARSGEGPGRLQHQDAAPHPHAAAQRQGGQPGREEPQEEGRRHRRHNLLPVGRQPAPSCVGVGVCICVWLTQTDSADMHPRFVVSEILKSSCGEPWIFPPDPELTLQTMCGKTNKVDPVFRVQANVHAVLFRLARAAGLKLRRPRSGVTLWRPVLQ